MADGSIQTRRAPGTCCPEPSCDTEIAPRTCKSCKALCPCGVWELAGRELILQCRMCGATRPYRADDPAPCRLCGAKMHWDIKDRHGVPHAKKP